MEDGTISYDAVVLAGGAADRLGGADKPALRVGGSTLLDRVLAACADASATVVVGPRRPTGRPVVWAREDPPGGGPLPALAAALDRVNEDVVLLLAADLPFLDARTVAGLLAGLAGTAGAEADGVVVVDDSGRDQPLLAAYRAEPLRRELALLATEYGTLTGLPLRLLAGALTLRRTSDVSGSAFDCDTWDDVDAARARLAGDPRDTRDGGDRGA